MSSSGKLNVTTPSDCVIVMTRQFNAPRALVWEAHTKPELIRQWLFMPPNWKMTICEEDVREGGEYLWQWTGPDGQIALTIRGVYREVRPPELAVRTEIMAMGCGPSGCAGPALGECLTSITLTEQAGVTQLTMNLRFDSKEARDGALASGMEGGVSVGYDQMEAMLTR